MPFGNECEFPDFAACVSANQDKDDPEAFCAELQRQTEESCAGRSAMPDNEKRVKTYSAEIKRVDSEKYEVDAVVSSESRDRDGDVIRSSGWDLSDFQKNPVLVADHNYGIESQIGEWKDMEVRGRKLRGTARYYVGEGNSKADWAFNLAKHGRAAFSVGFQPDMDSAKQMDDGGIEFRNQSLLEVSQVVIPANAEALQRMKSKTLVDPVRQLVDDPLVATLIAEAEREMPVGRDAQDDEEKAKRIAEIVIRDIDNHLGTSDAIRRIVAEEVTRQTAGQSEPDSTPKRRTLAEVLRAGKDS